MITALRPRPARTRWEEVVQIIPKEPGWGLPGLGPRLIVLAFARLATNPGACREIIGQPEVPNLLVM